MPKIPSAVRDSKVTQAVVAAGCTEAHVGKVRHSYNLPGHPKLMLVVATDRISIFDHVLNALIAGKGEILTALTVYWLTRILSGVPSHLMAHGSGIDQYLPESLRGNPELQSRALVVKRLKMLPIEFIVRGNLTGSGYKSYQKDGTVCGIQLRPGYVDGSFLDEPLLAPSTKAEEGHDVNISFDEMVAILTPFSAVKPKLELKQLNCRAWLSTGSTKQLPLPRSAVLFCWIPSLKLVLMKKVISSWLTKFLPRTHPAFRTPRA